MAMDTNVLVALCTLALALTTVIMAYLSSKNVALTGTLARISTLKLLYEEQKEIMENLEKKYGPFDESNRSLEKIDFNPEDKEDVQTMVILESMIGKLREEIMKKMAPYKKIKGEYEQLVTILGKK